MKHTSRKKKSVGSLANISLSQLLLRRQTDKMWEDNSDCVRKEKNLTLRDYSLNFSTKEICYIAELSASEWKQKDEQF